jgi:hypothetical protein
MTVRRSCVCLVLFGAVMAPSTSVLAVGARIEQPDFTLDVELDPRASHFLKAHQESVGVSIKFADSIGPGEVRLAYLRRDAKASFSMRVRDVQFDPVQVKRLRNVDYEVLVNVSSSHRKLDGNVLDCDLLQAPISHLQRRVHKIRCSLGDWAPRVKPKR